MGTIHSTTRCGELEADIVRKDSLGVVMRNWVSLVQSPGITIIDHNAIFHPITRINLLAI